MRYYSTRDNKTFYTAAEVILKGIAPDGGLFVPEELPELSEAELEALVSEDYAGVARKIFGIYLDDWSDEELADFIDKAYVHGRFDTEGVAPVKKVYDNFYVTELWHGPTLAFKDVALQMLPYLMMASAAKVGGGKRIAILTATSGDTGKAALEGFADVPGTAITVFFPHGGVSDMQRLQMVTQEGANTCVYAVRGNFDDAQTGVKKIFADKELNAKLAANNTVLSSANSINWGRLLPQIVYYFTTWTTLRREGVLKGMDKFDVTVPTGNFGNILAAYIAREMGLPIARLVCASNSNNVLTDFIKTGEYDKNRDFLKTLSPSMDILVSSNLERLLFLLSGRDSEEVRRCMDGLNTTGRYAVSGEMLEKLQSVFCCGYADDEATRLAIRYFRKEFGYTMDPHTAAGAVSAVVYAKREGIPMALMSTASPFKFPDAVIEAGWGVEVPEDSFEKLAKLEQLSGLPMPASLGELLSKPVRHSGVVNKEEMPEAVMSFLN